MTDLAIVAIVLTAVVGGYRLGLVAGATSWVFLLQGLVLVTLFIAGPLEAFGPGGTAGVLAVAVASYVGGGFAAQWAGRLVGVELRRRLLPEHLASADRWAGAAVGPIVVLVAVWLLVVPVAASSGVGTYVFGDSLITQALDGLPTAPDTSEALGRLAGPAALPQVTDVLGPAGDTSPPPADAGLPPVVEARVRASTVKVVGVACGRDLAGSGVVVGDGLVATNAHVVAGQDRTWVTSPGGRSRAATAVAFDPERDLALLRVPGLDQAALTFGDLDGGEVGAVFGHPAGRAALEVSPARVRQRAEAVVRTTGVLPRAEREVYVLAADLEPGDSGGPLVDAQGAVAGLAFAVASNQAHLAYAVTIDELTPLLAEVGEDPVALGPCR